jgi:hypothetical protein
MWGETTAAPQHNSWCSDRNWNITSQQFHYSSLVGKFALRTVIQALAEMIASPLAYVCQR